MVKNKGRRTKKQIEMEERRLEIATMYYRGNKSTQEITELIGPKWGVDLRQIQKDLQFIKEHQGEILREFMVKTVPNILSKAISRMDQTNAILFHIVDKKDDTINEKDKIRIMAIAEINKTAKTMVDIVTNNKSIVTQANELEELEGKKEEVKDHEFSGELQTAAEGKPTAEEDPEAVFE
jgi:hypothetical protein